MAFVLVTCLIFFMLLFILFLCIPLVNGYIYFITWHHRQSSRISRGFRGSTYCSVSNGWVARCVSTDSPLTPFSSVPTNSLFSPFPAFFLQYRRFLHFPAFLHAFSQFSRVSINLVFSKFSRVSTNSPSHRFPRLYMWCDYVNVMVWMWRCECDDVNVMTWMWSCDFECHR